MQPAAPCRGPVRCGRYARCGQAPRHQSGLDEQPQANLTSHSIKPHRSRGDRYPRFLVAHAADEACRRAARLVMMMGKAVHGGASMSLLDSAFACAGSPSGAMRCPMRASGSPILDLSNDAIEGRFRAKNALNNGNATPIASLLLTRDSRAQVSRFGRVPENWGIGGGLALQLGRFASMHVRPTFVLPAFRLPANRERKGSRAPNPRMNATTFLPTNTTHHQPPPVVCLIDSSVATSFLPPVTALSRPSYIRPWLDRTSHSDIAS